MSFAGALERVWELPAYCAALGTAPRRTGGKATMEKHRDLPSSTPSYRTEHMLATARSSQTRSQIGCGSPWVAAIV
ncbi:hypothetical protein GCM10029976_060620 [Kribbella albertanoniae]